MHYINNFIIVDTLNLSLAAPPEHEFLLFADASYGKIMKVSPHAPGSLISLPLSSIISRPVAIGYDALEIGRASCRERV